ncbi:type II toxin-antitoxin system HicB family antitoxin [bacterium]|nr:type II toxin-antitoxin system HicB family antitoxin [bacterium]
MKNIIKYKNFLAHVQYSTEDDVFFGKIEGINDLVTFEGTNTVELKSAFHEAVNDYIVLCKEHSKDIFKSYKGSFNIRVSPKLHKEVSDIAIMKGVSLNQFVQIALEHEVSDQQKNFIPSI